MMHSTTGAARTDTADRTGPLRSVALLIIVAYAVVSTLPAAWSGSVFGNDSLSHLVMSRHFVDQLFAGNPYPRWLPDMNAGLGSQVFHFYGPVPYYFTALFHPFVGGDAEGWHQLGLSASLAMVASGCACYAWLRSLGSETAALIGAVLYVSAPYHLAVDFYQRFALAELWSFVWMPLMLLQTRRIAVRSEEGRLPLAIAYSLLVLTHLPTTLLFSVIPPAYTVWMAGKGRRAKALRGVVGAMALGMGLAAIYLVPALATHGSIRIEDLRTGHFYFGNHFLFDTGYASSVVQTISERVGWFTALTFIAALTAWLLSIGQSGSAVRREHLFWIGTAMLALLMMLPPSRPVWEAIPLLQSVQFPWRFNLVLTVAATASIALCIATLGHPVKPWRGIVLAVPCTLMLMTAVFAAAVEIAMARELGAPTLDKLLRTFGESHPDLRLRLEATRMSRYDSFLPRWVAAGLFALSPEALAKLQSLGSDLERGAIVERSGTFKVKKWQAGTIAVDVDSPAGVTLILNQFYYPGWTARIDGGEAALTLDPSEPEGLIRIVVPGGTHQLRVTLETTRIERAGQVTSLVALCIAAVLVVRKVRGKGNGMQMPQVV